MHLAIWKLMNLAIWFLIWNGALISFRIWNGICVDFVRIWNGICVDLASDLEWNGFCDLEFPRKSKSVPDKVAVNKFRYLI
ncbi:hypothetical protein P8452_48360 [Trifolium repens]|nr:hypothetical protein P8452_48360 [Trifolium repens]